MKLLQVIACITLLCSSLAGCSKDDAHAQVVRTHATYQQPKGWSSECFGRLVVDVPGHLQFGSAPPFFYRPTRAQAGRYLLSVPNQYPHYGGQVSIAGLRWLESTRLEAKDAFATLADQTDFEYTSRLIRDGIPTEDEEAQRRRLTQGGDLPNNTFLWRHQNQFDFGTLVASDMRARMLHGKLSGEGSLAQARAVMDTLWPRYRPRRSGEIPSDAGICTPYGFLSDPPGASERDYDMEFSFPDPRHSNLVLRMAVHTFGRAVWAPASQPTSERIEEWPTPWEKDEASARRSKEKCRAQQGTASRDLFGCMFAGVTNIRAHREVEYLTMANGQKARLLVIEYRGDLDGSEEYEVRIEVAGEHGSATRPYAVIQAFGLPDTSRYEGMRGNKPPSLDEAIATVRSIAASLRLRPGAVVEGAPVRDTLEGVR